MKKRQLNTARSQINLFENLRFVVIVKKDKREPFIKKLISKL